jgi:flagellar hook assembly protein FlgD
MGRVERRLAAGTELDAGPHEFTWDGRDEFGARAAPGVYFVRGVAGSARLALAVVRLR